MGWEYHDRKRTYHGVWADECKRHRVVVRVSYMDQELIRARAYARNMCISQYILSLVHADRHAQRPAGGPEPVSGRCVPSVAISTTDRRANPDIQLSRGAQRLAEPLTASQPIIKRGGSAHSGRSPL